MVNLYLYQREGVMQIERFGGRALLADAPGLGKTAQSLYWGFNFLNPSDGPIVVVCPATLKWQWQAQVREHFGKTAEVLSSMTPSVGRVLCPRPVYILNYTILGPWLSWLKALGPSLIIVDEVHACRNPRSKQSKNLIKLCKGVPHVIGLSGTPLVNRPFEMWVILHILDPKKYPSAWAFGHAHCAPRRAPWGWEFKGATDPIGLGRMLRETVMIRRTKEEVLTQLPQKIQQVVPLDIDNRREYRRAEQEFLDWLEETKGLDKVNKARKAERVTRMGYLRRLASHGKMAAVKKWLAEFAEQEDDKLAMFAIHRDIIAELQAYLDRSCVVVHGDVSLRHRQAAVESFRNDDQIRYFLGQMLAAGVGLNLEKSCSTAVVIEEDWVPGNVLQAIDRIHRIGQSKVVRAFHLVAHATIEEDLCKVLQTKMTILDKVLDGKVGHQLDVFDELEAAMLRRRHIKAKE